MLGIGFGTWNVLEYIMHRFIFHNHTLPRKVYRYLGNGHRGHHRHPNRFKKFFLPATLTVPISLLCLVGYISMLGLQSSVWCYTGLIIGLYSYELMHYLAHYGTSKLKFLRYMRKHHLSHHFADSHSNYMVSNPVLDMVLTTHHSVYSRGI